MQEFTAFEKDALAAFGWDILLCAILMNAEFAAVFRLPVCIEIHDHGILTAGVIVKLIEMRFVKATFFVDGIMKFIACDASIAGGIEIADEAVHLIEEVIFAGLIVRAVEPVYHIAAYWLIVRDGAVIACAGISEAFFSKKGIHFFFEAGGKGQREKIFGNAYFVFTETIYEGIKYILQ